MIILLRKHAQSWVIKVILGLIMVTFVISFGVGQFTPDRIVLVKVGSDEILAYQFNREYERELEFLRERMGSNADAIAQQINLRKQVYERMINRLLLLNAAEAQGLVVSDDEVRDTVFSQPDFQVDNRFDRGVYRQILAQNGFTEKAYEERTRKDLQEQKYQRYLLAGLVVSGKEVDQRLRIEREKVEVEAFLMLPGKFKHAVQSDPDSEKKYYEAHEREFTQPAQFKIRYFVLSLAKLEPKVKVRDRALRRYYERNQEARFTTPRSVRASHILIKLPQGAALEEVEKTRGRMEELLIQLRAGGDFAKLARKHSEDASKNKGGDLGFFKREEMLPEFAGAAFALNKGELSKIVRTNFGLHIIKVTDEKPAVVKSFEQVKPQLQKTLRNQRAQRKLELEADRLPARISKEGMETVAREWGADLRSADWFDGNSRIAGLGSAQALYNRVKSRKPGSAGMLRRDPVQGHVFFEVLEKKDASLMPLSQVKQAVAARVIDEKSADAAVQAAKDAYEKFRSLKDFKAVAEKYSLPLITVDFTAVDTSIPEIGINRDFQEAAFRLRTEKPFGLSINGKTAHLMRLKRRYLPDSGEQEQIREQISARIQSEWAQFFLQSELERLKANTDIEVVTPELIGNL
ncbi:MAG: SurA N-terminal domain-containing protein [SAR324 cluster bacterium]|nr:SurA N-terminal domain-containing protein [SAR324 cluster bacterium]